MNMFGSFQEYVIHYLFAFGVLGKCLFVKVKDDAADAVECSPLVSIREQLSDCYSIPPLTWSKSDQPLICGPQ